MHSFTEKFSMMGRVRYYGEADNSNSGGTGPGGLRFQTIDATTFFDLEGSYQFNDNWRVTSWTITRRRTRSVTTAVVVPSSPVPSYRGRAVTGTHVSLQTSKEV